MNIYLTSLCDSYLGMRLIAGTRNLTKFGHEFIVRTPGAQSQEVQWLSKGQQGLLVAPLKPLSSCCFSLVCSLSLASLCRPAISTFIPALRLELATPCRTLFPPPPLSQAGV